MFNKFGSEYLGTWQGRFGVVLVRQKQSAPQLPMSRLPCRFNKFPVDNKPLVQQQDVLAGSAELDTDEFFANPKLLSQAVAPSPASRSDAANSERLQTRFRYQPAHAANPCPPGRGPETRLQLPLKRMRSRSERP